MHKPIVSIIAAIDESRGIGKDNKLLWDIPSDLNRFRNLTRGHACIMGRKTFESIGRPLPDRPNIVITRNFNFNLSGITVVYSLDEALKLAKNIEKSEIFIIGGAQIYHQAINFADKLYLTIVKGVYGADAFFPEYQHLFTKVLSQDNHQENGYEFIYLTLLR